MEEKELSDNEYEEIYSRAVDEFNRTSLTHKTKYSKFLTRCMISSFLSFLAANNLEVRDGRIYKKKEF